MSTSYARVSITLPQKQLRIVDQLRAERDLSRSGFIQAVLGLHINDVTVERLDRYLRLVERIQERLEKDKRSDA